MSFLHSEKIQEAISTRVISNLFKIHSHNLFPLKISLILLLLILILVKYHAWSLVACIHLQKRTNNHQNKFMFKESTKAGSCYDNKKDYARCDN